MQRAITGAESAKAAPISPLQDCGATVSDLMRAGGHALASSAMPLALWSSIHHVQGHSRVIKQRLAVACLSVELVACAPTQIQQAVSPVDLVIATTTDVHGRITAWDYYANRSDAVRGLTRAATIVDSVRAANPGRVILLDAGDMLQGNPLAYVAARVSRDRTNPIIATMNAMRYDAAAIGNHEYNYGVPYLDSAVRQAKFPFLSANTYRVDPAGVHAYRAWTSPAATASSRDDGRARRDQGRDSRGNNSWGDAVGRRERQRAGSAW